MITEPDYSDFEYHPEFINVESMSSTDILKRFPIELRHMISALLVGSKIGTKLNILIVSSIFY